MSSQLSLLDTPNVISSPVSVDGHTPCALPGGLTIDLSGPDHAHVNLSASQALEQGITTRDPFGGPSAGSSRTVTLQRSLESRLRARLDVHGSPEYALTWKHWAMQWGGADLCAAGVSAPHIRQRLFWVADSHGWESGDGELQRSWQHGQQPKDGGVVDRLAISESVRGIEPADGQGRTTQGADAMSERLADRESLHISRIEKPEINLGEIQETVQDCFSSAGRGECVGWMGSPIQQGPQGYSGHVSDGNEPGRIDTDQAGPITTTSCDSWNDYDLIPCADGKTRRIKSGLMPLVNGIPGRVGLIRGYGNAIVPQIAAEFIKAYGDIK